MGQCFPNGLLCPSSNALLITRMFSVITEVDKNFFISRNCLKEFGEVVSTSFKHVSSLNLEWLKVLPYNKNGDYGSYLSENYMGLARICKWIYLHINLITKIVEENYEFPDNGLDIKERTVIELQKWLISRHVSVGSRDGQRYLKPKLVDLVTTIQEDIENMNELLSHKFIEDFVQPVKRVTAASKLGFHLHLILI